MYQGEEGRKTYYETLKKSSGNSSEFKNVELDEIKVKLTLEDKEEIAKDILKIVLQDLNVIISDAIESLSDDKQEEVDVRTKLDFSDEKLQSMFEEVMKDVMKECLRNNIETLNKAAFNI